MYLVRKLTKQQEVLQLLLFVFLLYACYVLAAEELAAKKTRVKQSLMKRARSVAIFSLKLKERRAREALEKAKLAVTPTAPLPPPHQGGELSCIPIEKVMSFNVLFVVSYFFGFFLLLDIFFLISSII